MAEKNQFEVFLGMVPYSDGSGYQVKATVSIKGGEVCLDVQTNCAINERQWWACREQINKLVDLAVTIRGIINEN